MIVVFLRNVAIYYYKNKVKIWNIKILITRDRENYELYKITNRTIKGPQIIRDAVADFRMSLKDYIIIHSAVVRLLFQKRNDPTTCNCKYVIAKACAKNSIIIYEDFASLVKVFIKVLRVWMHIYTRVNFVHDDSNRRLTTSAHASMNPNLRQSK